MDTGWTVFVVILGISITGIVMWGIVVRVISREDVGVTAPTTAEDTLEDERCKHELLGHSSVLDELLDYTPIVKDTLKNKKRDDHFVKCIDMGPVATDPIPDEIWENIKEEEI